MLPSVLVLHLEIAEKLLCPCLSTSEPPTYASLGYVYRTAGGGGDAGELSPAGPSCMAANFITQQDED